MTDTDFVLTATARHSPIHRLGNNFIANGRATLAESRAAIAEADRLLVLYATYVRPLAFACATMTKAAPLASLIES